MNDDETNDDKKESLYKLRRNHGASIISQLVDIGNELNQQKHTKFRPFISHLQCLQSTSQKLNGRKLRRTYIDAFQEEQYVALSYTWAHSEYEDPSYGRYRVEGWDDNGFEPSPVRNCVLDRALSYMRYTKVQFLWIDAHCIYQDTCDDVAACTSHHHCTQKRDAVQAMDLVYQLSKHPIALLGRPLQNEPELDLLANILSGKLVNGDRNFRLSRTTTVHKARKALWLLHEITRDKWWGRAWTFQENYRGGKLMQLLIHHDRSLNRQKLRYGVFGRMPNELCVRSVTFSKEATRLCLALRGASVELPPDDVCWIKEILLAAGRYQLLLPESSTMTPRIVTDIEARELSKPWDRVPILANCCQYPVRLDCEALSKQGRSLSLSTLAMCLLNGEILDNSNSDRERVASLTTSEFLERELFKAFSAPKDDTRPLTFNKGCRLTDVKLTADGILTKGHIWELSDVIDTSMFWEKLPWINNPSGRLALDQRRRLLQLAFYLNERGQPVLADQIDEYLAIDAKFAAKGYISFPDMFLHRMAVELAAAIEAGQKLRLGSIWDPTRTHAPCSAVFVWSNKEEHENEEHLPPAYVFTSAWFRDPGSETYEANDIDRHVSLEVSLEGPFNGAGVPHLRIRRWLLGMSFFDGHPRTEVVFPWPQALQEIKT